MSSRKLIICFNMLLPVYNLNNAIAVFKMLVPPRAGQLAGGKASPLFRRTVSFRYAAIVVMVKSSIFLQQAVCELRVFSITV